MTNNQWYDPTAGPARIIGTFPAPVEGPHDLAPVQPRTLTVRIQPTGAGTVRAGDADISDVVTGIQVTARAGSRPTVCLDLAGVELLAEVDIDRVSIPRGLHEALLALGWLPPGAAPAGQAAPWPSWDELLRVAAAALDDQLVAECSHSHRRMAGIALGALADLGLIAYPGAAAEAAVNDAEAHAAALAAEPDDGTYVRPPSCHGEPRTGPVAGVHPNQAPVGVSGAGAIDAATVVDGAAVIPGPPPSLHQPTTGRPE